MESSNPLSSIAEFKKNKVLVSDLQANNVSAKLQSFYENNQLTDVVLVTEDGFKIPAHRNVLAASSDYFRAMFRSVMKEAKADEVSIGEIDGATLKLLLDFMYKSSIELCGERFASVFKAADFLQMSTLIEACCEIMVDGLDASNCLEFALIADQHNCSKFVETVCTVAAENFEEVSRGEAFLTLNEELLSKIISSNRLQITEEDLFICLATWFAYDKTNRVKGINNLLSHVRFALLSPQFIINNRQLLCLECHETIRCWLEWHLLPEKREDMIGVNTQSRLIPSRMGLFMNFFDRQELHVYDPSQNQWESETLPCAPIRKDFYKAHVFNKKIVIVGGLMDNGSPSRSVECYDLHKKNWQNLPPMRTSRSNPGVAIIGDDLYAVGGCIDSYGYGDNWQRSVEKFNFATRKWQDVASTNTEFFYVKVAALNGCLYAVGDFTDIMECYDPVTDEWTKKGSILGIDHDEFELVSVDGLLYAIDQYGSVVCYDPTRNTWEQREPLSDVCEPLKCADVNSRLLACVACNFCKSTSIEEYNLETNQWKNLGQIGATNFFDLYVFAL